MTNPSGSLPDFGPDYRGILIDLPLGILSRLLAAGFFRFRVGQTRQKKKAASMAASFRLKWTEPGSNRRPKDFQSFALPAELSVRMTQSYPRRRDSSIVARPSRLHGAGGTPAPQSSRLLISSLQRLAAVGRPWRR